MNKVLITGTSRGIGLATAQKFLSEGWFVIGTSTMGKSPITDPNFICLKLQLKDPASITSVAETVKGKYTPVDILINNAAVGLEPDTPDMDINLLRQTLEVNLVGLIDFTEQVLPAIKSGGHILNISSQMASLEYPSSICPAYCISKAGLNMYTRMLAQRLRRKGITVSSIDPGWVKTDMGGPGAPLLPEVPAELIFKFVHSHPESGYFWYGGKKRSW